MTHAASQKRDAFWKRSHYLDRMTLGELTAAYFQHYAIITYLALTAAMIWVAIATATNVTGPALAVGTVMLSYALVWYVLHRWVLHSQWMYKLLWLAPVWKRIHYDHHRDPNHLEVLFGAPYTTFPTLLIATAIPGWLIAGPSGAAAGLAAGLVCTCVYEFFHCIQHLTYKPRVKWLATMKMRHMEHHFHDENGNFGITNFGWDRVFGTYYTRPQRPVKSTKVFNLGYDAATAARYPWVANLSAEGESRPRRPRKDK
jgi:sterol desaturase/sphingolipid hydroxylase (fatty acid hydroxylase superfamily)